MFDSDYSFKGKHAEMVVELTSSFDEIGSKLFKRNLDVYLISPIVGFLFGQKVELDNSSKRTNVLYDALSKETSTLWFNYRLIMLLDNDHEPDFNKRVEKAFRFYGTEKAIPDELRYEMYVRGGVEVLYEKLMKNISTREDYFKNLYNFIDEFESLYSQDSKQIMDLVEIAKR